MDQREVPISSFDLDGFTKVILDFHADGDCGPIPAPPGEIHPSAHIVKLDTTGHFDNFGPDEGRSNFLEELESGHPLYFPFTHFGGDCPLDCADGQSLEEDDYDEDDEDTPFVDGSIGFVIALKDGVLSIDSASMGMGLCNFPPIMTIEGFGAADAAMEAFIDRFILS